MATVISFFGFVHQPDRRRVIPVGKFTVDPSKPVHCMKSRFGAFGSRLRNHPHQDARGFVSGTTVFGGKTLAAHGDDSSFMRSSGLDIARTRSCRTDKESA